MTITIQNFHGPHYHWTVRDDNEIGLSYAENGDYILEHRRSTDWWMVWHRFSFDDDDTSIEVAMKKIMGNDNSYYGLVWDIADINNYNYFLISPNGYYQIGSSTLGEWRTYAGWTHTNLINQSNQKNILSISKVNESVFFEINGTLVETLNKEYFFREYNTIGFFVGKVMKVAVVASFIGKPPDYFHERNQESPQKQSFAQERNNIEYGKVTKVLPEDLIDIPSETQESWTAKQLKGKQDRRAFEIMGNKGMTTTVSSYEAVLAWMSFGSSTFKIVDEDGKEEFMFPNPRMTFDEFIISWDELGRDLQRWVMDEVVYEANPQWDERHGKNRPVKEKTEEELEVEAEIKAFWDEMIEEIAPGVYRNHATGDEWEVP